MIKMEDLRTMMFTLKFQNVSTYLQSGNIIFQETDANPEKMSVVIADSIFSTFGLKVPVIIRSHQQLERIVKYNPFLSKNLPGIPNYAVTFLSKTPEKERVNSIKEIKYMTDQFLISSEEIYLNCPGGVGNTKFSNTFFESKLNVTATTRNWKTINELLIKST